MSTDNLHTGEASMQAELPGIPNMRVIDFRPDPLSEVVGALIQAMERLIDIEQDNGIASPATIRRAQVALAVARGRA